MKKRRLHKGYTTISVFCKKHSIRQKEFKRKLVAIGLLRNGQYKSGVAIVVDSGTRPIVQPYIGTNNQGSYQYREDALEWIFFGRESEQELKERVKRFLQRGRDQHRRGRDQHRSYLRSIGIDV